MKVVILHQHFKTPYTGGAIRSWYLATALAGRGIETVVITAHNEPAHVKTIVDGIEVHYLPVKYDNSFGFLARSFAFARFAQKCMGVIATIRDVSLCYAISVPLTVGLSAMRIKQKYKIPFVFEVGDLWPDAPVQLGYLKNYFLRRYFFRLEKKIYREATAIVALSPPIRHAIEGKSAENKQIEVIPNMADCEFYQPAPKDAAIVAKYGVVDKFVVSCIGAVGFANGLEYLLDSARACARIPAVHFILCGEGAMLGGLKKRAAELNLTNFTFVDFVDREGVRELLNITDAAFISFRNAPILETGSPNKFFDGLAAGKLMIVNFGGWIREEIERGQCGFYCNPMNPEELAEKIMPFVSDKATLAAAQRSARMLAEQKYSRVMLSAKFVELLGAVSPAPAR